MACGYDYTRHKIPNDLIVLTAVLGMGRCFWESGALEILCYLGKAVFVMALFYPFFKIGTIGAGDVKLLGVTAGYLPFNKILVFLFVSLLAAAIISLIKMWKNRQVRERIGYLLKYLADVSKNGRWRLYLAKEDKHTAGICLSGPILFGILLYLGGVY